MGSRTAVRVSKEIRARPEMTKSVTEGFCRAARKVFCQHVDDIQVALDGNDWGVAIEKMVDFKGVRDIVAGACPPVPSCPLKRGRPVTPREAKSSKKKSSKKE